MASLIRPLSQARLPARRTDGPASTVRDSLIVAIGGQLERALGTLTALSLRWGLDPERLGVYTGLRLYLDNTNRSSLGIGLGAVQEIPILRAAGRHEEAQRVADVAYTTNTLTCALYVLALLVWTLVRTRWLAGDPLAAEWTWGLVAIAGLAVVKRYESFLIAVLRAHQEFTLTTELDILESLVSAASVSFGLWLAGFWGLLVAVGVILVTKIAYLHSRHAFRFHWDWHWGTAARLMRLGLPILANTAVFGTLLTLDRALILWRVPDGTRAAGLYTIAIMGTSWALDLAGRLMLVIYPALQTTLGRTGDAAAVASQAARATEAQAPLLAAGSALAYLVGPAFLGALMPRYVDGLPALRPLLLGSVLLGLSWPARQALTTVERPFRLCLASLAGLAITATAGMLGADTAGIVGVAWGMTVGYAATALLTSATALMPTLGWRTWAGHQLRLAGALSWYAAGALVATHVPIGVEGRWLELAVRCVVLAFWTIPALVLWCSKHGWGGLRLRRPTSP